MPAITLHLAQRDDQVVLDHLMQFYLHDFSEWLPLRLGEQGLFRIQSLDDYWRDPATQAFLIRADGELAGFVAVDGNVQLSGAEYNISYFFIARRFRGQGVGQSVVSTLLSRLPGQWQIFHLDANLPAQRFWAGLLPRLTQGAFTLDQGPVDGHPCTFYRFASPPSNARMALSDNM